MSSDNDAGLSAQCYICPKCHDDHAMGAECAPSKDIPALWLKERDRAERLERELSAAIAERNQSGTAMSRYAQQLGEQMLATEQVEKERDKARDELDDALDDLRVARDGQRCECGTDDMCRIAKERDAARECLREAVDFCIGYGHRMLCMDRWRAAAGIEAK